MSNFEGIVYAEGMGLLTELSKFHIDNLNIILHSLNHKGYVIHLEPEVLVSDLLMPIFLVNS